MFGVAVLAAAAGTVTRVGNEGNRSYGRWIELDHGNGFRTRYAHLSTQVVGTGQRVSQGHRIGTVGDTGGSSGPHRHYERAGGAPRSAPSSTPRRCSSTARATTRVATRAAEVAARRALPRANTSGAPLTVRSGPGTGYRAVGSVADGASIRIRCQRRGQTITGTYGTTSLWDFIGTGYVSDAYVLTGSDGQVAPTCR